MIDELRSPADRRGRVRWGDETSALQAWKPGLWRFRLPHATQVVAGITDRTGHVEAVRSQRLFSGGLVTADQVHGVSIAAVDVPSASLTGCDALVTQTVGLGLAIRSADCLPLFLWDPVQQVAGLAHAGWRGLAGQLPPRLISFVHQRYHCHPEDLWIGLGPSIRACCYDVGPAFEARLAPWVQVEGGRRTCDLIACAIAQLLEAGVRPGRTLDSGICTACEPDRWFSVRRDGESCARHVSFIVMR